MAGSLYVVAVPAWGVVRAVQPKEGETVVISGAAGELVEIMNRICPGDLRRGQWSAVQAPASQVRTGT